MTDTFPAVSRRGFFKAAAALTATTGLGAQIAEASPMGSSSWNPGMQTVPGNQPELPFLHGVASGDPLPNSVILWTRVTPQADALPGTGIGERVEVKWEVAADPSFRHVAQQGTTVTSAERDHTVHVDATGLKANSVYYFRFTVLDGAYAGRTSPVGRTKTAPVAGENVKQLNFAFASCANWEAGYFEAYQDMATRALAGELDFTVFLGDYIYEYGTGGYVGKHGVVRPTSPKWEILNLSDYRQRYGHYRTDLYLQNAHAALPWIAMWDDHETANNAWREGAENHTPGAEGSWAGRREAALQAYFEWMPVRATSPSQQGHIYRTLQFGDLMQLTMLDLRTYRDSETSVANFGNPDRTMLGGEQFNWVAAQIEQSTAAWNVLGTSVMIAPLKLLTIAHSWEATEALRFARQQTTGFAINSDQWDGYAAERDRLLELVAAKNANTLFITGDIHSEWANSIHHGGREVAVEMVCTSISSANIDDLLTDKTKIEHAPNNSTSLLVEGMLRDANRWVKHLDFDAHGYSIAHLRRDEVAVDFVRVNNVELAESGVSVALTKAWRPGEGFVR
ncbi:Phospholipase D precursor [Corynebacterium kalinowskii]|uniref:Phospholipase D n=1 Tax=Corynebacterium kalinowskii TaxID=2675216 RepID=A0A6B8VDX5_9CORY|nr:alkaline phosphatase D family protein [Corynebacterium kalinowskii]QGU01269.1 Phospholipase D precursor [Corynebacterium kalinowskii]